jgi:protein lifeguard
MAATAKYQAAPTRDSFDEQPTQAPPSYQDDPAAGSSSNNGVLNYGTPRSEDDNVPDDFKVRSPQSFPSQEMLC